MRKQHKFIYNALSNESCPSPEEEDADLPLLESICLEQEEVDFDFCSFPQTSNVTAAYDRINTVHGHKPLTRGQKKKHPTILQSDNKLQDFHLDPKSLTINYPPCPKLKL